MKNLKLTQKIKTIGPKLKWLLFSEFQDLKLTSKYIDFICPEDKQEEENSTQKLHAIIKESLKKEFSPEIEKSASFEFLVEAVAHNLKKKQTQNFEETQ